MFACIMRSCAIRKLTDDGRGMVSIVVIFAEALFYCCRTLLGQHMMSIHCGAKNEISYFLFLAHYTKL